MSASPWYKFYPSDWRADPRLRMVSLAARGLWKEMLCLMHEAVPRGQLVVAGKSPTDAQLAILVGASPAEVIDLINELETAGIFSRTRNGVIYSRKMMRDDKKAATSRKNGKKGGNPSLCNKSKIQSWVNPHDKGEDKAQKPETRVQNIKRDTNVSPKKRGSRLPDDWVLPKEWGEWSSAQGMDAKAIQLEAEKFRNYWIAKSGAGATKRDWFATWRNWCLNCIEKQSSTQLKPINGGMPHGRRTDRTEQLRSTVTRAAAGTSSQDWG